LKKQQTNREKAAIIFDQHNRVMTTGEALRHGIHPMTFYAMVKDSSLEQLSRGVYYLQGPFFFRNFLDQAPIIGYNTREEVM